MDLEVVVKQGGKEVGLIDTKTNNRLTLRSGVYELELNGKPDRRPSICGGDQKIFSRPAVPSARGVRPDRDG